MHGIRNGKKFYATPSHRSSVRHHLIAWYDTFQKSNCLAWSRGTADRLACRWDLRATSRGCRTEVLCDGAA